MISPRFSIRAASTYGATMRASMQAGGWLALQSVRRLRRGPGYWRGTMALHLSGPIPERRLGSQARRVAKRTLLRTKCRRSPSRLDLVAGPGSSSPNRTSRDGSHPKEARSSLPMEILPFRPGVGLRLFVTVHGSGSWRVTRSQAGHSSLSWPASSGPGCGRDAVPVRPAASRQGCLSEHSSRTPPPNEMLE